MRSVWTKECLRRIHRKKFRAVRGSGLRLKREDRREGVRAGIRASREGSFRHWGRERMRKI